MIRYARHPDLRLTALDGEGVVLHLGTRRYYSVSASGLDLLEALRAPRRVDELIAVLTARYAVTGAEAEAATRAFLEEGRRAGLLTVEDAS